MVRKAQGAREETVKPKKYPRITPMRALELLRDLESARNDPTPTLLIRVRDALANHVKAALVAKNRRRR